MTQYIGILDGNGKTYGVRIPDLPGCYGAGRSPEAALSDSMSAAREWLAHRVTKGETPPKPRTMAQILKAEEIDPAANEMAVLVSVSGQGAHRARQPHPRCGIAGGHRCGS